MKIFTKTALACALAAGAVMAIAETVEIRDANNDLLVTYSSDSVVVEGGVITLKNAEYEDGLIPGIIPNTAGFSCGDNTQPHPDGLQVCIGTGGGGLECGTGTEENSAGTHCVPATPPTLSISSSPSSMGDGVSSATLTFQFSREVTGFTMGDIQVSPSTHTLSGFNAVDGDTFRATLNRSGNSSGSITVSVGSGSYQGTNGTSGGSGSRTINLQGGTTTIGNCTVPDYVRVSSTPAVTSFGGGTGLIDFHIPSPNAVLSHPFTTPSSSASGQVDLGGTSASSVHVRKMWISECADGAPLSAKCRTEGNLSTMRWVVGNSRTSCKLSPNTTYFFNIAYPPDSSFCNRSTGCEAIIHHKGGW